MNKCKCGLRMKKRIAASHSPIKSGFEIDLMHTLAEAVRSSTHQKGLFQVL